MSWPPWRRRRPKRVDAVRGRNRLMRDVSSAAQRARDASRNARRRLDEFERVVELAADIVVRGGVLCYLLFAVQ